MARIDWPTLREPLTASRRDKTEYFDLSLPKIGIMQLNDSKAGGI
jgi:hypothetical protein